MISLNEEMTKKLNEAFFDAYPYLNRPTDIKNILNSLSLDNLSLEEVCRKLESLALCEKDAVLSTDLRILLGKLQRSLNIKRLRG